MSEFMCAICGDDLKYSDELKAHVHVSNDSMVAVDLNGKKHIQLPKRKGCFEQSREVLSNE